MHKPLQEDILSANLAGFKTCAGFLNCIFKNLQLGRPLTEEEMAAALDEAGHLVSGQYQAQYQDLFGEGEP